MFKNISTSLKLVVLISFLLSLFLGLGIYNKREITAIKKNSDRMITEAIDPIIQLSEVRYLVMRGVRTTVKQLFYIDTSYVRPMSEIVRSRQEIKTIWSAYMQTKRTGDCAILSNETDQLLQEAETKANNLMVVLFNKDKQAIHDFALREAYISLEKAIDKLSRLIDYHEKMGNDLRMRNADLSQKSRLRFEIILSIFLMVALFLSYFIVNDIRKLVNSLKASNKKIKESELKYRSLFEHAGDGLFLIGEDKLIKAVNKKGVEITGYSHEELIKMKPETLHSAEDSIANPFNWSILSTGTSLLNQRKLVRKDGAVLDIEMNSTVIGENELLSVVRDITERLRAEKAQKITEEKFALAIKSSSDIICITTFPEGVFVEINTAFSELTGYSSEEVIGQPTESFNFYVDSEKRPKILKEILEKGGVQNQEIVFKKRNNELITTIMTSNLFYVDEKPLVFSTIKDITKEKLAHQELTRVETRIKELVDSTEAVIWEADAKTFAMTYVNPYVEKLFGYPVEDWYTENFWQERIYPEDREKTIAYCMSETKKLKSHTFEYRFISRSQEIFWVRDIVHVIAENGQPIWLRGVIIDITEEKKAAEELELANSRLKKMIDSTDTVIWEANAKTLRMKFVSTNAEKLFGYAQEEWYSNDFWLNHVYHEDRENAIEFLDSLRTNPRSYNFEYRFVKKCGEVIWMRGIANLIIENGAPRWLRGISLDISIEKKKETDLMELTTRLQLATKSAHLGIFDLDLRNFNLIWDDYSYRIFGLTPEETPNTIFAFLKSIHPEDRRELRKYHNSIVEGVGEYFSVFRILLPNKQIKFIESSAVFLRDSKGKAYQMIGVNRDITEIKMAQEQLLNANEILEDKVANRTIDLQDANKKINDSINYAHNIQMALLTKSEDCLKIFPKSFVLWSPKDAVSGDLFWCHTDEKYNYIAAIDCTGHGVPGALLSIVAKQTLDTIVISNGILEPKDILFRLDEVIVNSLHQHSKLVKDGMDIVFCRIEKATNSIEFAGAQRPLFYFDGATILEFPGNKLGIGGFWKENEVKRFEQTQIQGKAGDVLYLSSDGYYAQFGGKNGKKLMKRNFSNYLLSVANEPIRSQENLLRDHLINWQGKEEQVDDILVVGIEL
ncbi:MAG: PAS domain S-box protein [Crocinitomicaceae bacterium]